MIAILSNKKLGILLFCMVFLLSCASYMPVEKIYEDSKIVKIILRDKKTITGWYIINYDATNRISSINKYIPNKNTPIVKIQLQYRGKLLSSYTISSSLPESDIILHQSTHIFNYLSTNDLKRVDISFNKPASIKQAKTTFVRIQYTYTDKMLTGLQIAGDAFSFKILCTISYYKGIIDKISLDEKRYNAATKKFEQGLKGYVKMDGTPEYFFDELQNIKVKDKQKLEEIFTQTYIKDALYKIKLTKGNEQIIDYFIMFDSSL